MNRKYFPLMLIAAFLMSCSPQNNSGVDEFVLLPAVTENDIPDDIHRDSWARLPAIQGEDLVGNDLRVFNLLTSAGNGYDSGLRGPVGMWMHSPELAEGAWQLRLRVRYGTAIDQRLTELAIISAARELNNQYEYSAHEPLGAAAGLEQEIMDFVKYRRPMAEADAISGMGELEKTIIQFAREVISEPKVSQETFVAAIDLLGEEGVMDLTGLIGYYNFVAITLKAFDVQRLPGTELALPVQLNN